MRRAVNYVLSLTLAAAVSACPIVCAAETEAAAQEVQTETEIETETGAEAETENETETETEAAEVLEDGIYAAEFDTDSSMFRLNEALETAVLTVKDGQMTIHVSLASKNIVNLYAGLAEDAKKEGAKLLEPTVDEVTYSDGWQDEVYGFDIPVPVLEEEFDVALLGKKGKWYDHKVSVKNPVLLETETEETETEETETEEAETEEIEAEETKTELETE